MKVDSEEQRMVGGRLLTDLPAFCERALSDMLPPPYDRWGLTAVNICNRAENRGYDRPSKRAIERALATLDVERSRHWGSTWYRLASPDG